MPYYMLPTASGDQRRAFAIDPESLSDYALAHREIQRDPTYPCLSPEEVAWYIVRALEIGRDAAAVYAGKLPSVIALELNVEIHCCPVQAPSGATIRSIYDSGNRAITVYRSSVAQIQTLMDSIESTRRYDAFELHVAHELFHHLEETEIGRVDDRLPPVTTCRLGILPITIRRVGRCREIAAHKFAKELIGLTYLANAID